jgi:hypothetical protein
MDHPSGRPRRVNRSEHRRAEQTDDEHDWEKAFAVRRHLAEVRVKVVEGRVRLQLELRAGA